MPSERRLNLVRISQRELLIYFRPKQNLSQNLLIQRIVGNFLFYPARLVISSYYSLTCNSSPRPEDQIVSCTSAGSRFCLPCYELKMLIFILFLILFLIFLILFFEVQMLLRVLLYTYKHQQTDTLMFTIFVFMSRTRPIYALSM